MVDSHAGHKKKKNRFAPQPGFAHWCRTAESLGSVCFPCMATLPTYTISPHQQRARYAPMLQTILKLPSDAQNSLGILRTIFIIIPTQASFHQTPVAIFGYPQFQTFTFSLKRSYELSNFPVTPRSPGRNPHSETLSERHEHAT